MKQKKKRTLLWRELKEEIRQKKSTFTVYVILRTIVVLVMIWDILMQNYENLFLCGLTLILFLLPSFFERKLRIQLPSVLEIIILLFIFAAEILGEISSFYVLFPFWDGMLHTINGFLFAAVGFALVDIFNRNGKLKFDLSPLFLAIVAFCFSMTIGVLWEFFECGMDLFFGTDMQKDTVIHHISSVALDKTNSNAPVVIENIQEVIINGQPLGVNGYLDIGLYDTMGDLFVNFIGAIVFSIVGFFYVKNRGKGRFASQFIPKLKEESEKK